MYVFFELIRCVCILGVGELTECDFVSLNFVEVNDAVSGFDYLFTHYDKLFRKTTFKIVIGEFNPTSAACLCWFELQKVFQKHQRNDVSIYEDNDSASITLKSVNDGYLNEIIFHNARYLEDSIYISSRCEYLKGLSHGYCFIESIHMKNCVVSFDNFKTLLPVKSLIFSNSYWPFRWKHSILSDTNLVELKMTFCWLMRHDLKDLFRFLSKPNSLRKLVLYASDMRVSDVKRLAKVLKNNGVIEECETNVKKGTSLEIQSYLDRNKQMHLDAKKIATFVMFYFKNVLVFPREISEILAKMVFFSKNDISVWARPLKELRNRKQKDQTKKRRLY